MKFIGYLATFVALCISSVAAWYSIIGLTTIFPGSFWPIVIMGIGLEIGKVVTVSVLYRTWDQQPFLLKTALSCAIIILMLITSMGTFGYLSKAHIDQQVSNSSTNNVQLTEIQGKIDLETSQVKDVQNQIDQIDAAIAKLNNSGQSRSSLNIAENQRKNKDALFAQKTKLNQDLIELQPQKTKITNDNTKLEAELGPIKYIADVIYGDTVNASQIEKAIRYLIIMIVLVFDPLAIMLLLAANNTINYKPENIDAIEIDNNKIFKNNK